MTVLAALAAAPVLAQQAADGSASLTIYTQNLALVRAGLDRVLEPGLHAVLIDGLPTTFDQNTVMITNPEVTLLGARDFRTYQGATTGAGAAITLDVQVAARIDELSLVYLTTGMGWTASYAMVVAPDDATAQIDGYATIMNNAGTRYDGAEVQLLAGTINQQGASGGRYRYEMMGELRMASEGMAQSPGLTEASFGGYHLYTVTEPLTLLPGEARRIRMWGADAVDTIKEYLLAGQFNYYQQLPEPMTQPVMARYRVERPAGTEFGDVPLPAGQVRMFQPDDEGRLQLLGIAAIDNTPREQELVLNVGYAFDIIGTRTQTDYTRPDGNRYESAWRVELTNQTDEDVEVQVLERIAGDWTIMNTTHEAEEISAGAVLFRVPVPAGGEAVLEYRVAVRT
jgi:hypothetical protein